MNKSEEILRHKIAMEIGFLFNRIDELHKEEKWREADQIMTILKRLINVLDIDKN